MTNSRTVLALDVGQKRIGVALGNSIARIASPLMTVATANNSKQKIAELISEHHVDELVVGLPRGMEGQETDQTRIVRAFTTELEQHIDIPVIFQDEAVTSVLAEEVLRERHKPYTKEDIDMYAASQILNDYLNLPQPKGTA